MIQRKIFIVIEISKGKDMKIKVTTLFLSFFILLAFCSVSTVNADRWKRVYLASYPRSGNHWVRHLVEEATHIATSSVYCDQDPPHLFSAFPWGGHCCKNGYKGNCRYPSPHDFILLKTHFPAKSARPFDLQTSIKTIRIVRHPIDAFYSYYIYSHKGKNPADSIPSHIVERYMKSWRHFQNYWNTQPKVATYRYEDLMKNPKKYLKKILKRIGYSFDEADIDRAISKFPPTGSLLKHRYKYRLKDVMIIREELKDLMAQFDYKL